MRGALGVNLAFMLMNSFSTSADTNAFLSKYTELQSPDVPLEFLQNMAPKVTASNLGVASWPANPSLEWCPPGHGDLYAALAGSGTLDELLNKGYTYMRAAVRPQTLRETPPGHLLARARVARRVASRSRDDA